MSRLRAATGALLLAGGASVIAVAASVQPGPAPALVAAGPAAQAPVPAAAPAPPAMLPVSLPTFSAVPAAALPASLPAFDWSLPAPPAPTSDVPADPAPAEPAPRQPAPQQPPRVLRASEPVALEIPAVGVEAPVASVGLNPDGTIEVPAPGPAYDLPAWYRHSPTPGELGPAVVVGHVDHSDGTPSVFAGIGALRPDDEVRVRRADGSTVLFRVTGVAAYPKDAFPTDVVYGNLDHAGLRLITCSGGIDPSSGHYRANTVVFAAAI